MANKKYNEFNLGSFDNTKILLIADPTTGELSKITCADFSAGLLGPTIYTGDGTIATNRIVDLNSNSLSISNNGTEWLKLDPSSKASYVFATDGADGSAAMYLSANLSGSDVSFQLNANHSGTIASIIGSGTVNTITYTAGQHTFVAAIGNAASFANAQSFIQAFDPTLNGNRALINTATAGNNAQTTISSDFNNGVKTATIDLLATAFGANITHTADEHTFVGNKINVPSEIDFPSGVQSAFKMRSPDNTLYDVTIENGGTWQIIPD